MPSDALSASRPRNPAQSCAQLAALFPAGVIAAELREAPRALAPAPALISEQALLMAEERACILHCHERRIRDFTAGRLCAHHALQGFGVTDFSLLPGRDREPLWPAGFTGSITHTEGYSAAVVGRLSEVLGLGIDSEHIDEVQPSLWRDICAPLEFHQLLQCAPRRRRWMAALIFVAKEAFFKCQFPLTRARLEFESVRVHPQIAPAPEFATPVQGSFWIESSASLGLLATPGSGTGEPGAVSAPGWQGHFRLHDGYITAGISLPASA